MASDRIVKGIKTYTDSYISGTKCEHTTILCYTEHQLSGTQLEQPHIRLKPGEHVRNDITGDLKLT